MPSNTVNGDSSKPGTAQLGTFRRERGTYLTRDVVDAIYKVLDSGGEWTAPQVLRELQKQPDLARPLPVAKTIRRFLAKRTPPASGTWSLEDADGDDAFLVLPVLAVVARKTEGRVLTLSNAEAEWVVKLRRAIPDIPLWASYRLARMYLYEKAGGLDSATLDRIVVSAPWRNPDRRVAHRGILQVPPWLFTELTDRTYEGEYLNG